MPRQSCGMISWGRVFIACVVLSIITCGPTSVLVTAAGSTGNGDSSCNTLDEQDYVHPTLEQKKQQRQQQQPENSEGNFAAKEAGAAVGRFFREARRRLSNRMKSDRTTRGTQGSHVAAESNVSAGQKFDPRSEPADTDAFRDSVEPIILASTASPSKANGDECGYRGRGGSDAAENRGLHDTRGLSRQGWRVGEGIAVPADGEDAIWDQLETIFDRQRSEEDAGRRRKADSESKTAVDRARGHVLDTWARWHDARVGVGQTRKEEVLELHKRREAVVDSVRWAWSGYTAHAWGKDELLPLTRRGKSSFNLGLTIVDSMDTLWLAGEQESFDRCVDWVAESLDLEIDKSVNVFETTIRVLGGLLAAHHLSGEIVLLKKAEDLGARLANAFDSPSGIPYSDVNLMSGRAFNPTVSPGSSLSEATTLQLEFSYLSHLTGNSDFHEAAQRASSAVERARLELGWSGSKKSGLAPIFVDPISGLFGESGGSVGVGADRVTLGARGDSYYEYLLKQWLLSDKRDVHYLERYQESIRGLRASLLGTSYPSRLLFIGELHRSGFQAKMDHLVCFLPGTLALGYHEGAAGAAGDAHLELARNLMDTCVQMYESTATGLAPEIVHFNTNKWSYDGDDDITIKPLDKHNILRPETLESLYYLYWITREDGYRDSAWAIFQAFQRHCRVDRGGYAGLQDVTDVQSRRINKMETFFVSESLKYLLMIFSDENPMPFDRYVFNTEAHAFPITVRTEQKHAYENMEIPDLLGKYSRLQEAKRRLEDLIERERVEEIKKAQDTEDDDIRMNNSENSEVPLNEDSPAGSDATHNAEERRVDSREGVRARGMPIM